MYFSFEGKEYQVSFYRSHKQIDLFKNGQKQTIKSKFPYTRVSLYEVTPNSVPRLIAAETVGCSHTDKYSHNKGRIAALRELTRTLRLKSDYSWEFREALWEAYKNRATQKRRTKVEIVVSSQNVSPRALPPASVAEENKLDERVIH